MKDFTPNIKPVVLQHRWIFLVQYLTINRFLFTQDQVFTGSITIIKKKNGKFLSEKMNKMNTTLDNAEHKTTNMCNKRNKIKRIYTSIYI